MGKVFFLEMTNPQFTNVQETPNISQIANDMQHILDYAQAPIRERTCEDSKIKKEKLT